VQVPVQQLWSPTNSLGEPPHSVNKWSDTTPAHQTNKYPSTTTPPATTLVLEDAAQSSHRLHRIVHKTLSTPSRPSPPLRRCRRTIAPLADQGEAPSNNLTICLHIAARSLYRSRIPQYPRPDLYIIAPELKSEVTGSPRTRRMRRTVVTRQRAGGIFS
jgi:hypothetical protein